jgi:hypothetical protein
MFVRITDEAMTFERKIYVWVSTSVGAQPSLNAAARRIVVPEIGIGPE